MLVGGIGLVFAVGVGLFVLIALGLEWVVSKPPAQKATAEAHRQEREAALAEAVQLSGRATA